MLSADDLRELREGARCAQRLPLAERPALLAALARAGVELPTEPSPFEVWRASVTALAMMGGNRG